MNPDLWEYEGKYAILKMRTFILEIFWTYFTDGGCLYGGHSSTSERQTGVRGGICERGISIAVSYETPRAKNSPGFLS